jgi:hypothetical protein
MNIYTPNEAVNQGKPCALSHSHSTLTLLLYEIIWNVYINGLFAAIYVFLLTARGIVNCICEVGLVYC